MEICQLLAADLLKTKFKQKLCIKLLPSTLCVKYIRFRTRKHKFPIETGRWRGIPVSDRNYNYCDKDLCDEFHYLLTCQYFKDEEKNAYYYIRQTILKFQQFININSFKNLQKLYYFIDKLDKNVR